MIDLRKHLPSLDSQQIYELYLFPRSSSINRLITHTSIITYCGFFYGIGKAIQKQQSKIFQSTKFGVFGLITGYTHTQFNEISTGILIRNYGIGQYWLTNSSAAICNCFLIYLGLLMNGTTRAIVQAQKYAGGICLISMTLDLLTQFTRQVYLE